jgi:Holliday junction resolvase
MTGSDYERQLAARLSDQGYYVIRAPASGSATKRPLPDLAWADDEIACAELKATSQNVAYFDGQEVQALEEFAAAFNATPYLVSRFKGDTTYYCCRPSTVRRTESGRYAYDHGNPCDIEL